MYQILCIYASFCLTLILDISGLALVEWLKMPWPAVTQDGMSPGLPHTLCHTTDVKHCAPMPIRPRAHVHFWSFIDQPLCWTFEDQQTFYAINDSYGHTTRHGDEWIYGSGSMGGCHLGAKDDDLVASTWWSCLRWHRSLHLFCATQQAHADAWCRSMAIMVAADGCWCGTTNIP